MNHKQFNDLGSENNQMNPDSKVQQGITGKLLIMMVAGILLMMSFQGLRAQNNSKLKAIVLNIDAKNVGYDPVQMGNMVRLELEKLDTFDVMDRYDVNYLVAQKKLETNNCYGKICVVELGKTLGADKVLTGSIEVFGDAIIYTLRWIDVKTETIERTQVTEFLNMQNEIQTMTSVMLKELFNRPVDPNVVQQLMKPDSYDARARIPATEKVRLDGPRMGATMFTGATASRLGDPKSQGGYDAFPVMFQFGYQFEKQYLAAGQFQALFEFIPMITGLDQGLFIPSFTVMNGMRLNRYGWEFGFGPTFSLATTAEGYYDQNNNWQLKSNYVFDSTGFVPEFKTQLDYRGSLALHSHFVFAVGKTFRSGNMNIPVNAFAVPGRDGWRFGLSFGYNARNWYKSK